MAKVRFEPAGYEVDVQPGTRLIDVTDKFPEAKVPFSCRSASCGTCRVRVDAGMGALESPEDDELEVLEAFGNEKHVRLCCQLQLGSDSNPEAVSANVTLTVVDPT